MTELQAHLLFDRLANTYYDNKSDKELQDFKKSIQVIKEDLSDFKKLNAFIILHEDFCMNLLKGELTRITESVQSMLDARKNIK